MKICRFDDQRLGVVEGDNVLDVTEAVRVLPSLSWPLPCYDVFVANWPSIRKEIDSLKGKAPRRPPRPRKTLGFETPADKLRAVLQ